MKKGGFVGGTAWTTLSFVVVSIVYILRISILTRFLDKSDFGLVALVLLVIGFTNIFADLGVSSALLSQEKVTKKEYSSLFWGSLILSIFLYFFVVFASPFFAKFYDEDSLNTFIPILGLDLIISSLGRQYAVFKQKELKFKQLAIIKIISEVTSLGVACLLAFYNFGVWSLIISLLTTSVMNSILNFILGYQSHPLVFYLNYSKTKHLYQIGFYQTGSQVLDYISSQIDIIILGKILPMSDMGVYSVVKNLVLRIYQSINQVVTKVAIPIFAKLKGNIVVFREKYLSILSIVTIANTMCYLAVFLASKETLILFFGQSYAQYSTILKLLCVWGVFSSVLNCTASVVVISTGRTDLGFKWTQFRLLLNPIFIFVGAYFGGIIGTAISQAIYSFLTIFFYRSIVIKKILPNFSNFDFVLAIYKPLLVSCIVVFSSIVFKYFFSKLNFFDGVYINLTVTILFVVLLYLLIFRKMLLSIFRF